MSYVIASLIDAGLLHDDLLTVAGARLRDHARDPKLINDNLVFEDAPTARTTRPSCAAGQRLPAGRRHATGQGQSRPGHLQDQRGRSGALDDPGSARVFDDQDDVMAAFKAGELDRDVVVVVRFQGPRANGMPNCTS